MKKLSFMLLFLIHFSLSQSYNWPCTPFDQQHNINGTFCENRPSGSIQRHHFHDGVDIDLAQGNSVYSVINGTVDIGTAAQYGINAYVRVGRYAYVHVDAHPALDVGDPVTAFETVIGATNSWNHIHFKDGYPGGERNALRIDGGFSPFEDPYPPYIPYVQFYENSSKQLFSDNRVSGLVEIVARAYDKTDDGPIGTIFDSILFHQVIVISAMFSGRVLTSAHIYTR